MVVAPALFLVVWIVATLALTRLAWFRRRTPIADRLALYVDGGDPVQVEDWLRELAGS